MGWPEIDERNHRSGEVFHRHLAGVAIHLQQFTVLKKTASVANADHGGYAAFTSERGGMLQDRAFLDDESGDSWEQRREMRVEDAHNENRTCRNGHYIFSLVYQVRFPARSVPVRREA